MKKKRKDIFALLLLLLLCCACNKENTISVTSWGNSKPDAGVRISADVLSEKTTNAQTPFEVKVGIGNCGIYSMGNLEIEAPGFEITDAEGTTCTDVYTCLYEEFNDKIYGYHVEDEEYRGLKYSELFQLKYIGEADAGKISFWLSALQHDEEKPKSGTAVVSFFYSVKDGELILTTEPTFEEDFPLLDEVK